MKTVIISQARMTSTRLPGKILKEVLGKPLLEYQLERLRRVANADAVVIATTVNPADDPVAELCGRLGAPCFRGPENDVLARYYHAAREHGADTVVRVTSDCPLIDPAVVAAVIGKFKREPRQFDYVANVLVRTYPRGMDTEVFSMQALAEAHREATLPAHREHVTPFIHSQPARYRLSNVENDTDCSRYRWTVDTPEDFDLISKIIAAVWPARPEFTLADCLTAYRDHPEWLAINSHIEQKKV
ncbi:cytidylyltransferase domain-containing protein [Anaeroselena agilis]|uniref:Glycosyltransferase family protein n=1 Tax=Anaeroselena agilis TaxID=3063788 RepID=A0ABU3P6X3_9FIRM|nr:glycosyltransferase family protein [Selenomonadales bacterium 4137-cl]